jgi:hypothetical protein
MVDLSDMEWVTGKTEKLMTRKDLWNMLSVKTNKQDNYHVNKNDYSSDNQPASPGSRRLQVARNHHDTSSLFELIV